MSSTRRRCLALVCLLSATGCASATDRLNEGIVLQAQGRYVAAAYRYADAVDKDPELIEARDRLLAVGDSAVWVAMDDAEALLERDDPVAAANRYREVDRMMARVRDVGYRIVPPQDYGARRRELFDVAIAWQMDEGYRAQDEGRWRSARSLFRGARGDYLPSRAQVEESLDAETELLLEWSRSDLFDGSPRSAFARADEVLGVRESTARETVLAVRDLQAEALDVGTLIVAPLPVSAAPEVREMLGEDFEVALDELLVRDFWTDPPLFVETPDLRIFRREVRQIQRGRIAQTPALIGRAVQAIGADLAVVVHLTGAEVVEAGVETEEHRAVVRSSERPDVGVGRARGRDEGRGRARGRAGNDTTQVSVADTVTYETLRGELVYEVEARVTVVDVTGRQLFGFSSRSRRAGPFQRGRFDGDPRSLDLEGEQARFFDPEVLADQVGAIEDEVLSELAVALAAETYDRVLAGIR